MSDYSDMRATNAALALPAKFDSVKQAFCMAMMPGLQKLEHFKFCMEMVEECKDSWDEHSSKAGTYLLAEISHFVLAKIKKLEAPSRPSPRNQYNCFN